MRYTARVGFVGLTPSDVRAMAATGRSVAIYNGLVYDLTTYLASPPAIMTSAGTQPPSGINVNFMSGDIVQIFQVYGGTDVTKLINALDIDKNVLSWQKTCLRNLFTIGKVDNRESPQCLFASHILLVLAIIMVSIIGFKFLASFNFSAARAPEDHDKFVICQVPCYTEGDTLLRRTIDSLAQMKYDDKRKLLVIICDGMIVGSGNDRPTPHIVLSILGADPNLDPEPLSLCRLVKVPNSTIWARFTLDCTNAPATLYRTLSLSRLENQRSVLVRVIMVNEIRRCCLCTSFTRFVFVVSGLGIFFHVEPFFYRFTSIRQRTRWSLKCIIRSRTLLESILPFTSTCSWWMLIQPLILCR